MQDLERKQKHFFESINVDKATIQNLENRIEKDTIGDCNELVDNQTLGDQAKNFVLNVVIYLIILGFICSIIYVALFLPSFDII